MKTYLLSGLRTSILTTILVAGGVIASYCQPSNPGSGGDIDDAPISGIELLVGLGGLYGAKKAFNKRKAVQNKK